MSEKTGRVVALVDACAYVIKMGARGYCPFLNDELGYWWVRIYTALDGDGLKLQSDLCTTFEYKE